MRGLDVRKDGAALVVERQEACREAGEDMAAVLRERGVAERRD